MWLLPSRGRPHLIERVFAAAPTESGLLIIDDDQTEAYRHVNLPASWSVLVLPRTHIGAKFNEAFKRHPNEPYYGQICDDMIAETQDWDVVLKKAAGNWRIAYADDCLHRRIGAAAFGGDLIRALGWFSSPSLRHFYLDDVQEIIAAEFGLGVPRFDVKIPHLHFTTGQTPYDKTYAERPDHVQCKADFEAWRENEWSLLRTLMRPKLPAPVTITCLKAGNAYGPEYVNRLRAMVARNLTRPFRFVCFTDDAKGLEQGIEIRPIRDNLEGWWGKLALFAPGTFEGRVLFLDLDTVIVGSLDEIASYDGPFAILRDFMFADHYGSGVLAWEPSQATEEIWRAWNASGRPRPQRGDQEVIERTLKESGMAPDLWQDLFPGAFVSYKQDCFYRVPNKDAKAICFHGTPKPHECKRAFITQAWC